MVRRKTKCCHSQSLNLKDIMINLANSKFREFSDIVSLLKKINIGKIFEKMEEDTLINRG